MFVSPQSRFARRTAWDRSLSELCQSASVGERDGPLVDLTISNPGACDFDLAASDILDPLHNVRSLQYSPEPKGMLSAREAVVQYYAGHDATVTPEQIILTASTSEAYSHLFRLLCDPEDEVLIAQPSYPLFDFLADLSDVMLRPYPLFYDHGWWIDFAELERAIAPRTRAIILVHPNNPTGHATSATERESLFDLCRRYDLSLIVDEVFLDYPHERSPKPHSFSASTTSPLTFVLSGLSKIAALPQMKLGWIVALGPDQSRKEALARLEIIADTFLSVSTPSQLALPSWLAISAFLRQQILNRITANLALLREANLDVYEVEAGWNAILRLPRLFEHGTAFATLRQAGILTHPAHFYGLNDPNRVVISLIVPTTALQRAAEIITELLSAALDSRSV